MTQSTEHGDPELEAHQNLASQTFVELATIHAALHPTEDVSVFVKMFKMLREDPTVNGDDAISQLERAQNARQPGNYLETALVVSCSFLAEAHQEIERQRIGRAWYALAKACYWCGVMRSVNDKIDFTLHAADALRKAESAIGGKRRADNKYAEGKREVLRLAQELRPKRGWDSRREAVLAIKEYLLRLPQDSQSRVAVSQTSADRWERTFSDWLAIDLTAAEFRRLFPGAKIPKTLLRETHATARHDPT